MRASALARSAISSSTVAVASREPETILADKMGVGANADCVLVGHM
jgi:hypothetical protein